jgi:hypothetical protein
MRQTLAALLCAGLAAAPFGAAYAQNPQPAPPGQQSVPVAPPSAASPPPEKVAPGGLSGHPGTSTLSDKLAQQNGTLQPPSDVDPGMAVKSPHTTSAMPVVPPPGSKGGDQRVVPK